MLVMPERGEKQGCSSEQLLREEAPSLPAYGTVHGLRLILNDEGHGLFHSPEVGCFHSPFTHLKHRGE